jgi:hypothetical protein
MQECDAMLAYNLMSLFRRAVFRGSVQHILAALHHKVFAVGAFWHKDPDKRQQNLAVSQRRRDWFEGRCTNAGKVWNDDNSAPPILQANSMLLKMSSLGRL